jgi:hypothetical protein
VIQGSWKQRSNSTSDISIARRRLSEGSSTLLQNNWGNAECRPPRASARDGHRTVLINAHSTGGPVAPLWTTPPARACRRRLDPEQPIPRTQRAVGDAAPGGRHDHNLAHWPCTQSVSASGPCRRSSVFCCGSADRSGARNRARKTGRPFPRARRFPAGCYGLGLARINRWRPPIPQRPTSASAKSSGDTTHGTSSASTTTSHPRSASRATRTAGLPALPITRRRGLAGIVPDEPRH